MTEKQNSYSEIKKQFEKIGLGDHLCCIYKNKEEQFSMVVPYMAVGLECNEKCVYIVEESTEEEIIRAFKKQNIEIDRYIASKQFVFLAKEDAYLRDGYFDPDRMIKLLEESQKAALKEGYKGLRVTGEMTWVFTKLPGVEKLLEYEAKLNYFFPGSKSTAICQYNENRFSPEILLDVIHVHPTVIIYQEICKNPYYMPPDEFIARIKGELKTSVYEKVRDDVMERAKIEEERKKAEDAQKKAADEWARTFNAISDIVFILDKNSVILKANSACEKFLKQKLEDILGKKCYEVLHKMSKPWPNCPYEMTKKDKNVHTEEVGDPNVGFPLLITTSPIFDDNGELSGSVHIAKDISDIKKAGRELKRKIHDLEIYQKIAVEREIKMIELKKEITELKKKQL